MSKESNVLLGLVAGLAVSLAVVAYIASRQVYCPVCGGRMAKRNHNLVCTSCGARVRLNQA